MTPSRADKPILSAMQIIGAPEMMMTRTFVFLLMLIDLRL
jgi:hypothetical protein